MVFIDANENLDNGPLICQLRKFHLRYLIRESTKTKGHPTHQTGSHQIDGVYASSDIDCVGARFLPFCSGIGDHRAIVIDIPGQVLLGEQRLKIVRPVARRLKCNNSVIAAIYIKKLMTQLKLHKIPEKNQQLIDTATTSPSPAFLQLQEQIARVKTDCMVSAEKKCRKFCMGG